MEVSRNPQGFNCDICQHHHCDDTFEIEGSRGPATFPKWEINGEEYRTCPLPKITPQSREWLRLHKHYHSGHLPLVGGLLDQPAAYWQAMELIDSIPINET